MLRRSTTAQGEKMENNGSAVARQTEKDIDHSPRRDDGAANGGSELGKRFETDINENGQDVRSKIKGLNVVQNTVPDAFRSVPKFISPTVHAWLDAAVTAYFLGVGALYAVRGKRRPATAAFVNAGMVAGVSMLTDYHGTGKKPISFKLHGTLDAVQAATAGLAPVLHGFTGKRASALFYGQALNELAVIACTDWEAGMPENSQDQ
jgi:hypothetical protein